MEFPATPSSRGPSRTRGRSGLPIRRHLPQWVGKADFATLQPLPTELSGDKLGRRHTDTAGGQGRSVGGPALYEGKTARRLTWTIAEGDDRSWPWQMAYDLWWARSRTAEIAVERFATA